MAHRISLRDRLLSRLLISEPPATHDQLGRPLIGPCLIWTLGTDKDGYGQIKVHGQTRRVHTVMYELFVAPLTHQPDHLCRVRACASPAHLEDVTGVVNLQRVVRPNSLKTHCPRGHPYDEANTRYEKGTGKRKCRACGREKWREKNGVPLDKPNYQDPDFCINGHPRTEENTRWHVVKGKMARQCRPCGREWERRRTAHDPMDASSVTG